MMSVFLSFLIDSVHADVIELLFDFVASQIGNESVILASELNIDQAQMEKLQEEYSNNTHEKIFSILYIWMTKNPRLDHLTKIKEVLESDTLHRNDIIHDLSSFKKENYKYDGFRDSSSNLRDEHIRKVAQELAGNAYRLGRFLGIPQSRIRVIKDDNTKDIIGQTYKMLNWWMKQRPSHATIVNLCDGLVYAGHDNIADKLAGIGSLV